MDHKSVSAKISLLVELAAKDGQIDAKERKLINQIGSANGMEDDEVEGLIENPEKINYKELPASDRFDLLHDLVRIMKVDGKIFDEEIIFCLQAARKLGYPMEVIMELYGLAHANLKLSSEINALKRKFRED